jgi:hypothetical protein
MILALGVWFGLIALTWGVKRVRLGLLAFTVLAIGLLSMPSRGRPDVLILRQDYVTSLKHYKGVKFSWGGQNFSGMDSAGLVRRGLADALFYRGVRTFRPGLIRYALWLWWTECSPSDLGEGFLTIRQYDAPSLNVLEHVRVRAGDLAVVVSGNQVLAYLGDQVWITADPNVGRVLAVSAPAPQNEWFKKAVRIMRWRLLD